MSGRTCGGCFPLLDALWFLLGEHPFPRHVHVERMVAYQLREGRVAIQDAGYGKCPQALEPLAAFMRRLIHTLVPFSRAIGH